MEGGVPVAWKRLSKAKGLFRLGNESSSSFVNSTMNGQRCQFFFAIHMQSRCYCSSESLTRLTRGRRAKTPGPLSN